MGSELALSVDLRLPEDEVGLSVSGGGVGGNIDR